MDKIVSYFASLDFFGWLEIAAMIVGFIYVILQIRKTRKMWYFCILASIINIFVYLHNGYLSMMLIQFYYIVASFYGIRQWTKARADAIEKYGYEDPKHRKSVAICKMNPKVALISSAIALAVFFILAPIFNRYAVSHGTALFPAQPYLDTAIAVLSMLATYWLSRSYIQQWYIWLVVNIGGTVLFLYSKMYWMAVLYFLYIIMAIIGLANWTMNGKVASDSDKTE